jgi:hypothetical protein
MTESVHNNWPPLPQRLQKMENTRFAAKLSMDGRVVNPGPFMVLEAITAIAAGLKRVLFVMIDIHYSDQ